jgi:hypothetical protein
MQISIHLSQSLKLSNDKKAKSIKLFNLLLVILRQEAFLAGNG